MNQSIKTYYLPCTNLHCPEAIYNGITKLELPLIARKPGEGYACNCCSQALTAAAETAIFNVPQTADWQNHKEGSYSLI